MSCLRSIISSINLSNLKRLLKRVLKYQWITKIKNKSKNKNREKKKNIGKRWNFKEKYITLGSCKILEGSKLMSKILMILIHLKENLKLKGKCSITHINFLEILVYQVILAFLNLDVFAKYYVRSMK